VRFRGYEDGPVHTYKRPALIHVKGVYNKKRPSTR